MQTHWDETSPDTPAQAGPGEECRFATGPYAGLTVAAAARLDPAYVETVVLSGSLSPALRAAAAAAVLADRRERRRQLLASVAIGAGTAALAMTVGFGLRHLGETQAVAPSPAVVVAPTPSPAPSSPAPLPLGATQAAVPGPDASIPVLTAAISATLGAAAAPSPVAEGGFDATRPCGSRVAGAITAQAALDAVGQAVTVEFRVATARDTGKVTFLNSHDPYEGHFYVAIFPDDYSGFPEPPETLLRGRCVVIRGRVERFRGVPQMVLRTPDDLRVVGD